MSTKKPSDILYLNFNQDESCLSCGTQTGFTVFTTDPMAIRFRQNFDSGIGISEILFDTNIVALVGGGDHPKFPKNKLVIWDDFKKQNVWEFEYYTEVLGVRFNKEHLIVINETDVEVFRFKDIQKLMKIKTSKNPRAIAALSSNSKVPIIITPSKQKIGAVNLVNYIKNQQQTIQCHDSELQIIELNQDSTKFATCSVKGTLIRIFDVETGNKLKELRRGSDQSEIYSVKFSPDSKYLVVTSSKGTIHVFSLCDQSTNETSSLGFISPVLPKYFSSEWSMFKIVYKSDIRHIACLLNNEDGQLDRILIVDEEGKYSYHKFDLKNNEVFALEEGNLDEVPLLRKDSSDSED